MEVTKNDLSFNEASLDYRALLDTAVIAFAHTRNEIEELIHKTHDLTPHTNHASTARRLLVEAKQMPVAAETMHTLQEGLTRENITIINKDDKWLKYQ